MGEKREPAGALCLAAAGVVATLTGVVADTAGVDGAGAGVVCVGRGAGVVGAGAGVGGSGLLRQMKYGPHQQCRSPLSGYPYRSSWYQAASRYQPSR